jgi:RNA-directed DNA polymerase
VAHHALCNVIEPTFERSFVYDSYANRKRKGTHRALDRAQDFARRFRYVLQCDVEQFFPAIDHQVLREILARKIGDADVLWLIDQILASGVGVLTEQYTLRYFRGDTLLDALRPRGLPIGNLTSQFWANCYGRLFGRKGTVSSVTPRVDGNSRPHSGAIKDQALWLWSAFRGQRES